MPFSSAEKSHILMSIAGVGVKEHKALTAKLGDVFFETVPVNQLACKISGQFPDVSEKLEKALPELDKVLQYLNDNGTQIAINGGVNYPDILNCLYDAPYILYLQGNIQLLKLPLITVVGSRRCTRYGEVQTELIVKGLTENGLTVVSGLAEGIDTVAARAAFKYGDAAVCVIAGGFERIYPQSNRRLFEQHAEQGLAISEYPPFTKPARFMFPMRNRIMAALSVGVVLTEAGVKSGALITANIAIASGKNLFVLPGNVNSDASRGCNLLLKDTQTALITDYLDILYALGITPKDQKPGGKGQEQQLTGAERDIVRLLQKEDMHFDDISLKLGITASYLAMLLSVLEIRGVVKKLAGNVYGLSASSLCAT